MKLTYWTAPILCQMTVEQSIRRVCEHFEVSEKEIKYRCRKSIYNEPRAIISYLLRKNHGWTFDKIAKYFGRTHATILHHCNRVEGFIEVDKKYRELIYSFK